MKQCACTYKKPKRDGTIQSKCWCVNPEGGEMIGDTGEMQMYRDIISAGKILKSSSKADQCDCVCSGRMDT